MNHLTPYEILIAQKTEQVAVPDMADSIWANIEAQLDAGSSPDDSSDGPSQTPPGKGMPGAGNLLTVVTIAAVAIAMTWFFSRTKNVAPHESTQQPSVLPATEISAPTIDTNKVTDLNPEKNFPPQPVVARRDSLLPADNYIMPYIDTLNNAIIPTTIKPDSMFVLGENKPPVIVDSSSIAPPLKKPKGVKGISDNDYKIIGSKKDSSKKGD